MKEFPKNVFQPELGLNQETNKELNENGNNVLNEFVSAMEKPEPKDLSHHKRLDYCTNRPRYRDGRKLTAVKVCLAFYSC